MWKAILDRRATGVLGNGQDARTGLFQESAPDAFAGQGVSGGLFRRQDRSAGRGSVGIRCRSPSGTLVMSALTGMWRSHFPAGGLRMIRCSFPWTSRSIAARAVNVRSAAGKRGHGPCQSPGSFFQSRGKDKTYHGRAGSASCHFSSPGAVRTCPEGAIIRYRYTILHEQSSFPVEVQVFPVGKNQTQIQGDTYLYGCTRIFPGTTYLIWNSPAGDYEVKVMALGVENTSQLGVGKAEGKPTDHRGGSER